MVSIHRLLCSIQSYVKYATPIRAIYVWKSLSAMRAIFRVIIIIMHILQENNTLGFSHLWFGENVMKSAFVMLEINQIDGE